MLILLPFFALLPDVAYKFINKIYYPTPAEIIASNLLKKENNTIISMSSYNPHNMRLEESKEMSN
jgi:hypothetical protein